jgi:hypothetical protein
MAEHIEAPERVRQTIEQVIEQIRKMQAELQAIEFGARLACDVPDGFVWDGSGWSAQGAQEVVSDGDDS